MRKTTTYDQIVIAVVATLFWWAIVYDLIAAYVAGEISRIGVAKYCRNIWRRMFVEKEHNYRDSLEFFVNI